MKSRKLARYAKWTLSHAVGEEMRRHQQGVISPHLLLRWARGIPRAQLAGQGLLGSRLVALQQQAQLEQQVQLVMAKRTLIAPTVLLPPAPVDGHHSREGGGTGE